MAEESSQLVVRYKPRQNNIEIETQVRGDKLAVGMPFRQFARDVDAIRDSTQEIIIGNQIIKLGANNPQSKAVIAYLRTVLEQTRRLKQNSLSASF
tara:strand:+ start:188 stop:475 length:288 start_codon:yes stop_codon:yes gene_type:complete